MLTVKHLTGGGVDYNFGPYNHGVTLTPRMPNDTIDIPIINDMIRERNESFKLSIVVSDQLRRFINCDTCTTTVTIVDTTGELLTTIYWSNIIYQSVMRPYKFIKNLKSELFAITQLLCVICYHTGAFTQLLCHVSVLLTSAYKQAYNY